MISHCLCSYTHMHVITVNKQEHNNALLVQNVILVDFLMVTMKEKQKECTLF